MMPYSPLELAEAFIKTGEVSDALEALDQQLAAQPNDETARRMRASILLRQVDEQQIQQALNDLHSIASPTADDYSQISIANEKLSLLDEAVAAMHQALQLKPDDARLTERLIQLLAKQEKITDAIDLVRQQPKTWRWLQWEGDLLVLIGKDRMAGARYGLALAQLESRFESDNPHAQAIRARLLLARAHTYRRLGDTDIARSLYQEALHLHPDDPTINFNLGLLCALEGDLEKAVSICNTALAHATFGLREEMLASVQGDELYAELSGRLWIV